MAANKKYEEEKDENSASNMVSDKAENYTLSQKSSDEVEELDDDIVTRTWYSGNNSGTTSIIAGKTDKAEWQMTATEKMNMARRGLSKKDLENLKRKTNLDYDKLSTLLSTTRATLINKKGTEHFSASLSERIVGIADVYSYGFEVFEDETKFNNWVFRPNQALGGKQPFELLDNQFGREEVKNVIGRIDYGVYS